MPDDWRVWECANQLLLFATCDARGSMLPGQGRSVAIPAPLPPFDDVPNSRNARLVRDRIAANPLDVEPLAQFLKLIRGLPDNPKSLDRLREHPSWRIGDVVEWWIRAGGVFAAWMWDRAMFGNDPDPDPQQSIEGLSPEAWLFSAMLRNLHLEADEEHPVFWFVAHAEAWRLTPDAAVTWPARWHEPAMSREACLLALLEWCGDPRHEVAAAVNAAAEPDTVERWARDYEDRHRDFARAALRLLRRRCRFGDVGNVAVRGADWRVCTASGSPRRPRVLRMPIHAAADPAGPALVPGWAVVPWPAAVVARLRREVESRPPTPLAIARALGRADAWAPEERGFRPVLPPRAEGESSGAGQRAVAPRAEAERLVALASLAAVVAASPARAAGEWKSTDPASFAIEDRIRWAWAVEGIDLRWAPAAAGTPRVVVLDEQVGADAPRDGEVLCLACDDFPGELVVGRIGRGWRCPDELFAAVDDLDWRWWALAALRYMGRLDDEFEPLTQLASEMGWERHKLQLLQARLPADQRALVDAHAALHRARLRIERECVAPHQQELSAWVTEAVAAVERAICGLLAAADPAGVARLVPPRTASGAIDLPAWMAVPVDDRSPEAVWAMEWETSTHPFGQPLREVLDHDGRSRAVFSAGEQAAEADLRLLSAPGVVTGSAGADVDAAISPLRVRLLDAVTTASSPDMTGAISEFRESCTSTNADGFDRLMQAAVAGVPAAVAWVRLMQADSRFGFSCHPAVEATEAGFRVSPGRDGDSIEWEDHDTIADGGDVRIRFATDVTRSRRVVSRGRPAADSAEAHAARLVAVVAGGPASLVARVEQLRRATDRRRTFGAAVESAADEAVTVGDELAAWSVDVGDGALEAFRCLAAWCAASGLTVAPHDWHPEAGAPADGLAVERVDFHPKVPEGRVVVTRFGVTDERGTEVAALQAFISAGPPPAGYDELRDLVAALPDEIDAISRFRTSVFDFPRRVRSGQTDTSVAGLFDVAWKAVMKAPDRDDLRQAAAAVHRLLDRSYGLITFEPKTVGEYPDTWLQTGEGGRPRGLRVDRLLRPGLRTIDNKLKWPAIVETR